MAVSYGAAASGTNGTTSINVGWPGSLAAGHYVLAHVASGDPTTSVPAESSAFVPLATAANTDGTFGTNDQGPRRTTIYGYEVVGGESGTVTFTQTGGTGAVIAGLMYRWSKTLDEWDVAAYPAHYELAADDQTTLVFEDVHLETGDQLFLAFTSPDDTAALSGQTFSAPGFTFGSVTELLDSGQTTGNDLRAMSCRSSVASGSGVADLTFTLTQDESGGAVLVVLRDQVASSDTTAPADPAVATGTAPTPTPTIQPSAGPATVTGAAGATSAAVSPPAAPGVATAAASPPSALVRPVAGTASAAGSSSATVAVQPAATAAPAVAVATAASTTVAPSAGAGGGTAVAAAATVATTATGTAPAGAAGSTGQAAPATTTIQPSAGPATATSTAARASAASAITVGAVPATVVAGATPAAPIIVARAAPAGAAGSAVAAGTNAEPAQPGPAAFTTTARPAAGLTARARAGVVLASRAAPTATLTGR